MAVSKEQWAAIKATLTDQSGVVHLKCDEYLLHVHIERCKQRLVVAVYVNGKIKGVDMFKGWDGCRVDSPIGESTISEHRCCIGHGGLLSRNRPTGYGLPHARGGGVPKPKGKG